MNEKQEQESPFPYDPICPWGQVSHSVCEDPPVAKDHEHIKWHIDVMCDERNADSPGAMKRVGGTDDNPTYKFRHPEETEQYGAR